ncbi:hypothetical protein HPB52_025094 [Rhipicephalus sanguineus]|uniref:Uncharacterized protein n=1 Tax=Rhipicephalus sanguineus TaxID=34632 RepID=A0A9D4YRP0_RHISA|nr:hypothetical protein HPB52_025094 [Rhipicephalus sanguineus]
MGGEATAGGRAVTASVSWRAGGRTRDPAFFSFLIECKLRSKHGGAPKAPDIRGEDEEASAAEQPPTGHIDDFDRLAQQVPDVEATAATTDQELPLLRRSKRIRKPIQRF